MAADIAADPFLARLSLPGPYAAAMACHLIPFAFAWAVWGGSGLIAMWATLALAYNLGDAVNSLGHLWGAKTDEARSEARNNPLLALFAFGDGWHADHHARPASALVGPDLGRYDLGWLAIAALVRLRLANVGREGRPGEMRTPVPARIRQAA
jgi:fatty-acid desaturase